MWRRGFVGPTGIIGHKDCEKQCTFPSACHWKAMHAVKDTGFDFLDPTYLGKEEPDVPPIQANNGLTVRKGITNKHNRLINVAKKRTTQIKRSLLPISEEEEEEEKTTSIPAMGTSNRGATQRIPILNGLGLSHMVMDFSSVQKPLDEQYQQPVKPRLNIAIPGNPPPPLSARIENVGDDDEDDADMTDWVTETVGSPTVSPHNQSDSAHTSFDFRFEPDLGPQSSSSDDSPVSPSRSAWEWTAGGIGVALSSPSPVPIHDEIFDEQMTEDESMDDVELLWDRGTRKVSMDNRKLGV